MHKPKFYFYLKVHKLEDGFTFIWKNILCYIFLFLLHTLTSGSSGLNCRFIRREYGFTVNSKISLVSSGGKVIITFYRFPYYADFDIKIVLLGQNSFQWINFCWVEYCVFQTYTKTLKSFVVVTCSWLF